MVRYQNKNYQLPSVEEFKQLLYDNDIGYKTHEGKLYVRRFYLIPTLLFPNETILRRGAVTSRDPRAGEGLLNDIKASSDTPKRVLQWQRKVPVKESKGPVLEDLFKVRDRDVNVGLSRVQSDMTRNLEVIDSEVDENEDDFGVPSVKAIEEDDDDEYEDDEYEDDEEDTLLVDSPDWDKLLEKYNLAAPTTALEREREQFFAISGNMDIKESTNEVDLYHFRRERLESMLLIRARLYAKYEEKEAARRYSEWRARKVWLNLPRADIELLDPAEAKLMSRVYQDSHDQSNAPPVQFISK
jgi:hypothetical protein